MKVAYFLGALNRGGAETLILDICRAHEKVPYDFVCMYRHEGNMSDDFKQSGAPLRYVPKKGNMIRYMVNVRLTLLKERVTIVHSQTPSNTLLLAFALLGTGIKIVTTIHTHLFADAAWWRRNIVYTASEKILFVSKYQKEFYEKKWRLPKENKMEVVYNGIDFAKIDKAERMKGLMGDGIKLAMVGNFVKGRSQMVVARAIERMKGLKDERMRGLNVDFYFVGRRDEKQPERYDDCVRYCEEKGLKNVHFLGSRNDVPEMLKTIDGFVYSTEHDTFGIAIIEAIAAGQPVVVNDWPVMKEICSTIPDSQIPAVHFFRTDDIEDCAQRINELLTYIQEHGEQLREACRKASDIVRQKYSISNHINQLNTIYQSI